MLEARVLGLGVLADNDKVDVLVAGLDACEGAEEVSCPPVVSRAPRRGPRRPGRSPTGVLQRMTLAKRSSSVRSCMLSDLRDARPRDVERTPLRPTPLRRIDLMASLRRSSALSSSPLGEGGGVLDGERGKGEGGGEGDEVGRIERDGNRVGGAR